MNQQDQGDTGKYGRECILEAKREVSAAPAPWQPIETAPKDGAAILLFEPNGHYGTVRNHYMPPTVEASSYYSDDPRLIHYDDYRYTVGCWTPYGKWSNRNCADVVPTHWMPLPEPPK